MIFYETDDQIKFSLEIFLIQTEKFADYALHSIPFGGVPENAFSNHHAQSVFFGGIFFQIVKNRSSLANRAGIF